MEVLRVILVLQIVNPRVRGGDWRGASVGFVERERERERERGASVQAKLRLN